MAWAVKTWCAGGALPIVVVVGGLACADIVVSGIVRDQDTLEPIPDALISLQAAGVRTRTLADGSYSFSIPDFETATLVAAKAGYYNASTVFSGVPSGLDIAMGAVPHMDNAGYAFVSPQTCGVCHADQLEQWSDSPMARAGLNTWVHDIFNGTGTPGGMGGFVYTRDSVFAGSNPASECASCHQPEAWIPAPFTRMENPTDPGYPSQAAMHGVSCDVCHKVAHVDVAKINFPGIFPGAVDFSRPGPPTYAQVQYGLLGDSDFSMFGTMQPSYQPQLMAEVCAACHQDAADPEENHSYTGVISEPTYLEWASSPYSDPDSPVYANCLDCHMPSSGQSEACVLLKLNRDPSTLRDHAIVGTTPEFLENSADLLVESAVSGAALTVEVDVVNSMVGHHLPTGVTVRNMILLVEAWDAVTGEPLVYTGDQVVHELGGLGDPEDGYYAGQPGRFFAKVNHDANGGSPTFFTDATGIVFDNRIPALETDHSSYTFAVPETASVRVRARLIYRRAFRFLVDAKQWTSDGHGNPLADVLPPHFGHLMEHSDATLEVCRADITGEGALDFFDVQGFLAAFAAQNAGADFTGDGVYDFFDVLSFLQSFAAGCP